MDSLADILKGMKRAMTAAELAALLSISRQQIYKLAAQSRVPYFRISGSLRFDPGVIAQWLTERGDGFFRPRMNKGREENLVGR